MAVGAAALAPWWLWPLPKCFSNALVYPLQEVPGITADYHLVLWSLAWDVHALTAAPWRLFHGNILHPSPFSLAYSEHFLGNLTLFAPPYLLTGNPVVATNVLIAGSYVACAVAMYVLLRNWTGRPAAALGSLAFAFTSYRYSIAAYIYFLNTFYLPVAAACLWRWLASRRAAPLIGFACALLAQMAVSYYLAYATIIVALGFALATALVSRQLGLELSDWAKLGAAVAAAALVFAAMSLPYFELRRLGVLPKYGDPTMEGVGTLSLIPYFGARRVLAYLADDGSLVLFAALAVPAVILPRRSWRWPLALGAFCCAAGLVLSFGPGIHLGGRDWWSPYRVLAAVVPGFGTMRQPLRFILVFEFGLAILLGLGAERMLGRGARSWAACGLAVVGWAWLSSGLAPHPIHLVQPSPEERAGYDWLARHGGHRPVIEIPRAADFTATARRMFLSTLHWSPIVEGYSGYYPRSDLFLYGIAQRLPEDGSALQDLVDYAEIRWILVHLDELPEANRRSWESAATSSALALAYRSDRELIFRVDLEVRDDRRDRLFSRETSLDGTPLAPLRGACPGRLRLVDPIPDSVAPGTRMGFELEIRNDSQQAWPAHGLIPRHLLQVRRTLLREDGGAPSWKSFGLPSDVRPGRAVRVRIQADAPARPGAYAVRLEVEQVLDGPLSACGLEPLVVPFAVGRGPLAPSGEPPKRPADRALGTRQPQTG